MEPELGNRIGGKGNGARLWAAVAAVFLPVLFLMVLRIFVFCPDGESDVDSFYHAAIAQQGPAVFAAKEFPQTSLSVWQTQFSDKELGFHFLLWGVMRAGARLGLDNVPPFHYQSFFLLVLLFSAVAITLSSLGVRRIWLWTVLLAVIAPRFSERLIDLRPHLLAMTLFVLAVWALTRPELMRGQRRWVTCFVQGILFGYCYSNPHFVVMPVGAYMLAELWSRRDWRAVFLPFAALAGAAVALVLHPQFPNTFLIWKIQCVDVVLGKVGLHSVLRGGSEWLSNGWDVLRTAPFLLIAPAVFAGIGYARWKRHLPWSRNVRFTGILALGTGIGMCLFFRMVEYGVFSLIFAAAVWLRPFSRSPGSGRILAAAVLAACLWSGGYFYHSLPWRTYRPEYRLAAWLREKRVPSGTVIGHLSWGDFPQLYYAMPEYRFLCGLDPMFAAGEYRPAMLVLEELRRGTRFTAPDELSRLIGSRWLWVSDVGRIAAVRLYLYGYVPVFDCPDGCLFKLDEPLHAGKPADVPRLAPPSGESQTGKQP